jgi:hypothetical protein
MHRRSEEQDSHGCPRMLQELQEDHRNGFQQESAVSEDRWWWRISGRHEAILATTWDSSPGHHTIHTSTQWHSRKSKQDTQGDVLFHAHCCQDGSQVVVPCHAICLHPYQHGQAVSREISGGDHVEAQARVWPTSPLWNRVLDQSTQGGQTQE